jgi:hypothetical protein
LLARERVRAGEASTRRLATESVTGAMQRAVKGQRSEFIEGGEPVRVLGEVQ